MDDPKEFLESVGNIEEMLKQAFAAVPPSGGQAGPPMDPAMAGGAPPVDPNTGMPMDPAMMQGGGAMPPGAMPPGAAPADPAAAAPAANPVADPNAIVTILTGMQGEIDNLKTKVEGIENLRQQREQMIADQTGLA